MVTAALEPNYNEAARWKDMKKPVVNPSEVDCPECMGAGYVLAKHPSRPGVRIYTVCKECKGKGRVAAN